MATSLLVDPGEEGSLIDEYATADAAYRRSETVTASLEYQVAQPGLCRPGVVLMPLGCRNEAASGGRFVHAVAPVELCRRRLAAAHDLTIGLQQNENDC
jgi:hypothetical protein